MLIGKFIFRFNIKPIHLFLLAGALLIGLLVRSPGVLWGYNFPTGWYGHHPDEYTHLVNTEILLNPNSPPRWDPNPYPKGMAAHVAVPLKILHRINNQLYPSLITPAGIITIGRVVSVIYGTISILMVFLLAKYLTKDARIALLATWIFALGGLHVSESHFFVSDVPAIFWALLGTYLLFLDMDNKDKVTSIFLMAAGFCFGVSIGLKLQIFYLPSLIVVSLLKKPRFERLILAIGFSIVGFVLVNFLSYSPQEILDTLRSGISSVQQFNRLTSALFYLIEFPTVVSFPVAIIFCVSVLYVIKKMIHNGFKLVFPILIVIILPFLLNIYFIVFEFDHFPRHLIPLIPWISIVTAWGIIKLSEKLKLTGKRAYLLILPLLCYLAIFVYDGEKDYIMEPRNKAEEWLLKNAPQGTVITWDRHEWIPGYVFVSYPGGKKPDFILIDMIEANHYLSGMGLKNSYPHDYHTIYGGQSQQRVDALQGLFLGKSDYFEVNRFAEGYFMPEFTLIDNLLGNRSRNYLTEVVIFKKK